MSTALVAVKEPFEASRFAAATALLTGPAGAADGVHVLAYPDERAGHALVDETVGHLRARHVDARGHVLRAVRRSVAEELARRVREWDSEVVVMGSRSLVRSSTPVHASLCQAILSETRAAALIIPNFAFVSPAGLRRVIAAVARDRDSTAIAAQLQRLDQHPEVLVIPMPRMLPTDAAGAIAHAAETSGADLVVVGSRRLDEVASALFGGVSRELARRSELPVLVAAPA
jgi:nucleotide-binding universal stress UspA family protein